MSDAHERRLRPWLSVPFAGCALILLAAAAGLKPALGMLIERMSKKSIALRRPLEELDVHALPSFRYLPDGGLFPHPIDAAVGTEEAVKFVFETGDGAAAGNIRDFDSYLLVTYYSDPRDQVPHTPEVCYRQIGARILELDTAAVEVPPLGPEPVDVKWFELERRGWRQVIVYAFVCNGEVYSDREQVRWAIGKPGDEYVYFSKIEVCTSVPPASTLNESLRRCKRLFSEALPLLIEEHFPSRAQVSGREPAPPGDVPAG